MSADDRYPNEPPPDAYSRVTNPGRFRPLHPLALELLDRLATDHAVSRAEAFDLLPGIVPFEHARPPVSLTPVISAAAPIAIAFTTFPGLMVRCGRWLVEAFPSCGCDACRETAAEEGERLQALLRDVVAGRFREELTIPLFGDGRLSWALGDVSAPPGHRSDAFRGLPRAHARALRGGAPHTVQWQPWPTRPRGAPGGAPAV